VRRLAPEHGHTNRIDVQLETTIPTQMSSQSIGGRYAPEPGHKGHNLLNRETMPMAAFRSPAATEDGELEEEDALARGAHFPQLLGTEVRFGRCRELCTTSSKSSAPTVPNVKRKCLATLTRA
jgi:hypothetical protein